MSLDIEIGEPWMYDPDQLASNAGVIFAVRFVATVLIKIKSNKLCDMEMETLFDCIKVAWEEVHLKPDVNPKKKKGKNACLTVISEQLLIDAKLKITDESLTISEFATDKSIAESDICKIQYVSIGDSSTLDFIGYVVSNTPQHVVCHVVQCLEGTAFEVLSTITQAIQRHISAQLKAKALSYLPRRPSQSDDISFDFRHSGCSCCDRARESIDSGHERTSGIRVGHLSSYWKLLSVIRSVSTTGTSDVTRTSSSSSLQASGWHSFPDKDSRYISMYPIQTPSNSQEDSDGVPCTAGQRDSGTSSNYSEKSDQKSAGEVAPEIGSPLPICPRRKLPPVPAEMEQSAVTSPPKIKVPSPVRKSSLPDQRDATLKPEMESDTLGDSYYPSGNTTLKPDIQENYVPFEPHQPQEAPSDVRSQINRFKEAREAIRVGLTRTNTEPFTGQTTKPVPTLPSNKAQASSETLPRNTSPFALVATSTKSATMNPHEVNRHPIKIDVPSSNRGHATSKPFPLKSPPKVQPVDLVRANSEPFKGQTTKPVPTPPAYKEQASSETLPRNNSPSTLVVTPTRASTMNMPSSDREHATRKPKPPKGKPVAFAKPNSEPFTEQTTKPVPIPPTYKEQASSETLPRNTSPSTFVATLIRAATMNMSSSDREHTTRKPAPPKRKPVGFAKANSEPSPELLPTRTAPLPPPADKAKPRCTFQARSPGENIPPSFVTVPSTPLKSPCSNEPKPLTMQEELMAKIASRQDLDSQTRPSHRLNSEGSSLGTKVVKSIGEQCYVGKMDRWNAESRLQYEGDFLLRTNEEHYVLSVRSDKVWAHNRIVKIENKHNFTYCGKHFTSVTDCVNFYYEHRLPLNSVRLLNHYTMPSQ